MSSMHGEDSSPEPENDSSFDFDPRPQPRNWAVELGNARKLSADASRLIADGEYNVASDMAYKALGETAAPLQELMHSGTSAMFLWQLEQLHALSCALSAQFSLGNLEEASSLGSQLQSAYNALDLDLIVNFSEGVCCHGNYSPTGDCQSAPPCTLPLC
jgi:hypothetical protein